jgi:Raf kinase inhibitor-like YbhB/YbcL family protein
MTSGGAARPDEPGAAGRPSPRPRAAAPLAAVDASAPAAHDSRMALTLTSPAFANGREIPSVHTCEGDDTSPQLAWSDVPAGTRSLALVVDDPDAPDPRAPKTTWVHWVVHDVPPAASGLPAAARSGNLPAGAREGTNDWKRTGYGGPCPPIGRHRYFFKLYALDTILGDLGAPTKAALERAMKGHVVAQAELVGTYEKRR